MSSRPNNPRLTFVERERKILASASDLFAKNGFKGTTTKAVAQGAGINEALLFRHFPNKEKLYSKLLKSKIEDFEVYFLPQIARAKNQELPDALSLIARVTVAKMKRDQTFLRMMLFSALENHPMSRRLYQQRLPLIEFMEKLFQARMDKGEMESSDPGLLARAFFSMIYHYVLITKIFRARTYFKKSEKEVLAGFIHVFLNGAGR